MAKVKLSDVVNYKITPSFRWDLQIVKFPNKIDFIPPSQELNIRCESADIPKDELSKTDITIRGYRASYPANRLQSGEITLTLLETDDMTVNKFIKAWREAVKDWEGKGRKKEDITAIVRLIRYDQEDEVTWVWEMYNVFPSSYDTGGNLGADTPDPLKPTLTLSYDYFKERDSL